MNIFVIDKDPMICTIYLDDKRLVKMILETTQLLSTARHSQGLEHPYKPTHKNHPCTKWVMKHDRNYVWLWQYLFYSCMEYKIRFNKHHKCSNYIEMLRPLSSIYINFNDIQFVNCSLYKDEPNVFKAYKKTLNTKWDNDKRQPLYYREPLEWRLI